MYCIDRHQWEGGLIYVLSIDYFNLSYNLVPFRLAFTRDDRLPTRIRTRPTKGVWASTSETDHLRICTFSLLVSSHFPHLNFSTMGDILEPPGLSLLAAAWPTTVFCSGSSLNMFVMLDLDPPPDIAPVADRDSALLEPHFVRNLTQPK